MTSTEDPVRTDELEVLSEPMLVSVDLPVNLDLPKPALVRLTTDTLVNGNPSSRHSAPPSPLPSAAPLLHRVDTDATETQASTTTTLSLSSSGSSHSDSLSLPFNCLLTDPVNSTSQLIPGTPSPASPISPILPTPLHRVNTDIPLSAFETDLSSLSLPHTIRPLVSSPSLSTSLSQPQLSRTTTDVVTVSPFHSIPASPPPTPPPPQAQLFHRISGEFSSTEPTTITGSTTTLSETTISTTSFTPLSPDTLLSPPHTLHRVTTDIPSAEELYLPDPLFPSSPSLTRVNTDIFNSPTKVPSSNTLSLPSAVPVLHRIDTDFIESTQTYASLDSPQPSSSPILARINTDLIKAHQDSSLFHPASFIETITSSISYNVEIHHPASIQMDSSTIHPASFCSLLNEKDFKIESNHPAALATGLIEIKQETKLITETSSFTSPSVTTSETLQTLSVSQTTSILTTNSTSTTPTTTTITTTTTEKLDVVISEYQPIEEVPQGWIGSAIAVVSMFFFVGWFYHSFLLALSLLFYWLWTGSSTALLCLIFFLSSGFWPTGDFWPATIETTFWSTWRQYFSFKKISILDADPTRKYMWCSFPHGIFPMGTVLGGTYIDDTYRKYTSKGMTIRGVGASIIFHIPLFRHLNSWMGLKPATHKGIVECLKTGSCAIFPGGIAELFLTEPNAEHIYLKKRLGFVKIAIQEGADLVPVYYFGSSVILKSMGKDMLSSISRRIRASLVFYYGRWGLPIPFRTPILMVVGPAVSITKNPNPTEVEVVETHARFMKAVEDLYHKYKHLRGWKDRPLVIH